MLDDVHNIRLAILDTLHCRGRRPLTLGDLARELKASGISKGEIRAEIDGLIDHGYIENLMPTRDLLVTLTAKGRDQVTRDATLEEYIHGAAAHIG